MWQFGEYELFRLTSAILFVMQFVGLASAIHALRRVRSAQATTAWCVGLITLPIIVVPMYWVFGRSRFFGYRELLRQALADYRGPVEEYRQRMESVFKPVGEELMPLHRVARVVGEPISFGNRFEPLIGGQQTYESMLAGIAQAKEYILVQFYIIENDTIGQKFADALIERAADGVEVRLLYDDIGSQWLPKSYIAKLVKAGIHVASFDMGEGLKHRLQINFRNHRKIIVVDGKVAYTGGLNIGDEYIDGGKHFDFWRDTHLRLTGQAVRAIQAVFAMDWYWAKREALEHLRWSPDDEVSTGKSVLRRDPLDPTGQAVVVATGPADLKQRCTIMICEMAATARKRFWITTPYLVPSEAIEAALETAVARGVDVKILIPGKPDHIIAFLAGYYYEQTLLEVGVKIYRFPKGFMHQKVFLVDDKIAAIGSTNLDNRSLHLNFELSVLSSDLVFVAAVEKMLQDDFEISRLSCLGDLGQRSFAFQICVGASRLFSPVL